MNARMVVTAEALGKCHAHEPKTPGVRLGQQPVLRHDRPPSGARPTSALANQRLPDALEPGFHCVRTPWIRGFMAFHRVRRIRIVMLMVPGVSRVRFWDVPAKGSGAAGGRLLE